jgi:hypothetical protein
MIGFIAPYTFTQLGTTGNTALSLIYTLYSSPFHKHYNSVFTSRILATGVLQSHSHFNSHVKSSCHSLIPSLPILLNHFDCHHQNSSQFSVLLLSYNTSARTPRKTPSSIVRDACLLVRYLSVEVLLLLRARVLREYVYKPVA